MSSNILVIGAGELGTAVLENLATHSMRNSSRIAVMVRESSIKQPAPAKKAELERLQALEIQLVAGDIESAAHAELSETFSRYDTVISCSGMTGSAGLQLKLAKAALTAKVSRFVPWQYGVDYDTIGRGSAQSLFTEQLDVRDLLRNQSATQWLVFTVGVFMSFIFVPEFGMVDLEKKTVRAFGSWDNHFTATTVQDIGRVVAETVFDGGDVWTNSPRNVVFVAGDTVTYDELATSVGNALQAPITRELWDLDFIKSRLQDDPNNGFKKYGVIWAEACGVAWSKQSTFNATRKMAMSSIEESACRVAAGTP